jgi:hypothetical protein
MGLVAGILGTLWYLPLWCLKKPLPSGGRLSQHTGVKLRDENHSQPVQ